VAEVEAKVRLDLVPVILMGTSDASPVILEERVHGVRTTDFRLPASARVWRRQRARAAEIEWFVQPVCLP